jgi:hypothetical protein
MNTSQHEHIANVVHVATYGTASAAPRHEQLIRDSWFRCVHEHQLDPTRMQEAIILPHTRLREHQDQMEAFLHIARHGLESLYAKVAGLGYVVLLTDAKGVTVDFLGDLVFEPSLRKAGLYLGADWSEQHAGTCGVGTCISTGQALTVAEVLADSSLAGAQPHPTAGRTGCRNRCCTCPRCLTTCALGASLSGSGLSWTVWGLAAFRGSGQARGDLPWSRWQAVRQRGTGLS